MVAAALCAGGPQAAQAVSTGADRDAVIAELGEPAGVIRLPNEELLYFDRGTVRLRDGVVVDVQLVTAEEARRRREAEAAMAARVAASRSAQAARRKAEGEALLRAWMEDPVFRRASLQEQADRWTEFARRYPEVPVAGYLSDVTKRLEEQQVREEQERRIAMLEFRALQAEQTARAAEERASRSTPWMTAPGGRSIYYVSPWTVPGGPGDPSCVPYADRHRDSSRHGGGTSGTSSSWPYDFGMRGSPVGVQSRQPGMKW